MASRSTNNSMQSMFQESLSSATSLPQLSIPSIAPTASSSSTPGQVVVSSGAAISPDMVALITQTVQAALAAEQAKDPPSGPVVSSPSSTLSSSTPLVGAIGGVPLFSALGSAPSSVSLPGPSSSGRPFSFVVLSFISTFTVPVMSVSSSAMSAASSLFGASRDVAMAGTVQPSPLVDQPFVVGPGFSPVPVKLVLQIVAGKYIDLSKLLPANLQLKEPEPQLMLDGRLVLTSQPKKPRHRIDDIATWSEAFAIFSLILVTHFPHRWKDLMQYQLLILRTHWHFTGRVWLTYDQAFREHAAATRLTDWSCMNVQLFNFHAAGSSARSSTSLHPPEWEPLGSSGSLVVCISWNRGRCTSPLSICRYAHHCSSCSGAHRATAYPTSSKVNRGDGKQRSSFFGEQIASFVVRTSISWLLSPPSFFLKWAC